MIMKNLNFAFIARLIIVVNMLLLCPEIFAQEKINSKLLRDKEWVEQLPDGIVDRFVSYKYTNDTCFIVAKASGMSINMTSVYYLTDDWNGTFEENRLGVLVDGKYMIEKWKPKGRDVVLIYAYKFLKLTETDLVLKLVKEIEMTETGLVLKEKKKDIIIPFKYKQK